MPWLPPYRPSPTAVHTHYWMQFSGMPHATDLGNNALHHLMSSTKRVPAQKLYRKQKARDCDWSKGKWCKHRVHTAAGHTRSFINCSSDFLSTSTWAIMSLIGFNISNDICSIPTMPIRQGQQLSLHTSRRSVGCVSYTWWLLSVFALSVLSPCPTS